MFMAVLLPDSGLTNSINNKLKQMTMRKNFKFSTKTFLGVFAISAVLSMSALTSCNEKPKNEPKPEPEPTPAPAPTPEPNGGGNTPGGGSSSEITMNISLANDTTVYLLAGEKYRVSYEISKGDISLEGQTSGWSTSKLEENGKKFVEITTPESSNLNGNKTFDLVMGSADKQDMPKITAHFKIIDITERGGTFMLCEGVETKETGTISYISPEGVIIDTLYRRVNKSKLGNVAKDFFMHDGKGYILSKKGVTDKGEDGMLIVVDLKTFKKVAAFSNEDLAQLKKPRHVASLDNSNIYIMDEISLWHLDATTRQLTKIEDLSGTPSVPFVEQNGKLYYAFEKKYWGGRLKEITPGEKTVKELALPNKLRMKLDKITDVMPTNDGKLWVVGYYAKGSGDILGTKYHYSIQKIDPNNSKIPSPPCNWIHVELPNLDDYHKIAVGSNNEIYYRDRTVVYRITFDESANPTMVNDEVGRFVKFGNTPEAIQFADYTKLLGDSRMKMISGFAVNPVTNNIFAYTNEVYGMEIRNKKLVELDGGSEIPSKPLRVWTDVIGNYVAGFFFNK